jgi:phosphopantothenoylcysteine decarboxylase / phosphopantothenate---cysteine ligase
MSSPRVPRSHPPSRPPSAPPPERGGRLSGRRITLCVTGSIAAYKAALVARLLLQDGAEVQTVFTTSAARFMGEATFSGLTGKRVLSQMFDPAWPGEPHVELAQQSDLVLIVPATADVLSRIASGRADDLVTATVLCARCPVMVVPAMHPSMWSHPTTQRNVARLESDARVERVGPVYGEVASGERGVGRMAEPEEVIFAIVRRLTLGDLAGRHVVVTAGPTAEDLDPVRFLTNRSSGKMGFAIAERAAARGARVTLIAGPVALATPYGVTRVDVRSAVAMRGAVWQALGPDLTHADALIMAAAVGDYRFSETHATKLKRGSARQQLELVQNPDILAEVGEARKQREPVLIGFAVETENEQALIASAKKKLAKKRVDVVVANLASDAFGKDENRALVVEAGHEQSIGLASKFELADRILDWLGNHLAQASGATRGQLRAADLPRIGKPRAERA